MLLIYLNKFDHAEYREIKHNQYLLDWFHEDGLPKDISPWKLPLSVFVDGERVLPYDWASTLIRPESLVEIHREPKGTDPFSITAALIFGAKAVLSALMPKLPSISSNGQGRGEGIDEATAKGNKVKVNDVIPELAGYNRRYGDYLTLTRRYFAAPREQWIEMLLCVGKGEYDIPRAKVKIGETPLISLGDDARFTIYPPGADLSAEGAHLVWYTAPEVDATSTGAAGLELTVTSALTRTATASVFAYNDDTVSIPAGGGFFPVDWEDGLVLNIAAPYDYTVVDGTGDGGRDIIQGDIAQLGFSPGDIIEIQGANQGTYTVHSATATELQLDYAGGAPGTGLVAGPVLMAIGFLGLRYRITAFSVTLIEVERLTWTGAVDTDWPGWTSGSSNAGRVQLDASNLEGGNRGPFPACPENEVCTDIEYDVFFPSGIIKFNSNGSPEVMTATHVFEYRDMNVGGAWTPFIHTETGAVLDAQGFTYRINLPYPMRPECRMRRTPSSVSDPNKKSDTMMWQALKGLVPGITRTSFPGVTTMAVHVRGGDRISSQTENQINCICTRILPELNGSGAWGPAVPTRKISSWIGYIARSIGYSDSDIDLAELQRLENIWTSRGDVYDQVITDSGTVKERMIEALAAGFSDLTIDRGLITPVIDMPRGDLSNADHMYPAEVMTEVLETEFNATTLDDYDGVDVEYRDARSWTQQTVQCRLPGDLGVRVDKVTIEGVTDRNRAYRLGMRRRLQYKYNRKTYTFSCELDALNSKFGDYVALGDSVAGYGKSSELLAVEADSSGWILTSSEPLDWSAPGAYLVAIRRKDGSLSGPYEATEIDEYQMHIDTLDFTPDMSGEWEPPFLQFGPEAVWCYPALVQEVSPSGVSGCKVTAINYDPRVYAYDNAVADN